jgi:hypothetical protein
VSSHAEGAQGASVAIEGGGAMTSKAEAVGGSSSPGIRGDHAVDLAEGITLESELVLCVYICVCIYIYVSHV